MTITRRAFLAAGASALLLAACGGSAATPSSPAAAGSGGGDWQQQWDAMVTAAKKEGTLSLASAPSPDLRTKVPEAFQKQFGINIEYLGGSTGDLTARLKTEQAAGQYTLDSVIAGADSSYLVLYGQHFIEPIKPWIINPEALDATKWLDNKLWYMDPDAQYIVRVSNYVSLPPVVNTEFVKPDELKSWNDLLKPQYKGKIGVLDPTVSGSGGQTSAYIYNTLGADYTKKLYVDQNPGITQDNRQQTDWLGRGTYPITLSVRAEDYDKMTRDGFKLALTGPWQEAPGYVSGGFSLVHLLKNPPHPNAAHLFLNWMMMKDGQTAWNSAMHTPGTRTDIDSAAFADGFLIPKPGLNYFDSYNWDYTTTGWAKSIAAIKQMMGKG